MSRAVAGLPLLPADETVPGNFAKSKHFSSGGYDVIASQLFQKLNVDTFYREPAPQPSPLHPH